MFQNDFFGREYELDILEKEWRHQQARLLILYGRRRIGKTRLITHWMERYPSRTLYWVAEPNSSLVQLRSFSQALYEFENGTPPEANFTYTSWKMAFEQIPRIAAKQRFTLALDEFTYLMSLEPGIDGVLQNIWDHHLKQSDVFLIISGSHLGMMEREVLSRGAPLYGRSTSNLLLPPLPFSATKPWFPNYSAADRVALYAIFGGVPAYWESFDPNLSLEENITNKLLSDSRLMQDEARFLLQDYVSSAHNYFGILQAIANNKRTPKEIATFTGMDPKHIPNYLKPLIESGFVERKVSITALRNSRKGRHHIIDPFLRFYFRFLTHRQSQLARRITKPTLDEFDSHFPDFIGQHTWEELCQEWLLYATDKDILPFMPDNVGSLWNREAQIDVVGINARQKKLFLGECKWLEKPVGRRIVSILFDKTELVLPQGTNWEICYLIFSRNGWTDPALEYAHEEVTDASGERWQSKGVIFRSLEEIDAELQEWT